ncbi:MAG: transposase [Burkholderiales bacterium]|nr:transposase [Burkholderiales bacterium]
MSRPASTCRQRSSDPAPSRFPDARITFDRFKVIRHASAVANRTRRLEQRSEGSVAGLRWSMLHVHGRTSLRPGAAAHPRRAGRPHGDAAHRPRMGLQGSAARDPRTQADPCRAGHAARGCTCVTRPEVEPMTQVAALARRHVEGIVTRGFREAFNGRSGRPQAPSARLRPLRHDQARQRADRRQARLPTGQPSCHATRLKCSRMQVTHRRRWRTISMSSAFALTHRTTRRSSRRWSYLECTA